MQLLTGQQATVESEDLGLQNSQVTSLEQSYTKTLQIYCDAI